MKKWLCTAIAMAVITSTAFAQVSIDPYSYEVTVTGNHIGSADIMIAFGTDTVSDENLPVWIRNFTFSGDFEVKPSLSDGLADGTYGVFLNADLLGTIDYMGKDSLDRYVKDVLSNAADAEDLKQKIDAKKLWYGIDGDELELIGSDGLAGLLGEMPLETKNDFVNRFFGIVVSKKIKGCTDSAQAGAILEEYKDRLAIDFENSYEKLELSVRTKLCGLLIGADFDGSKFEDVFAVNAALAKCVCSQSYLALRDGLVSNESVLGIDLSAYSADLAERCSRIVGKLGTVKKVGDLKDLLDKAFEGGTGAGSGGGATKSGGGSGGGISIRPTEVMPQEGETRTDEKPNSSSAFGDVKGFEWAENAVKSLKEKGIADGSENGLFEPQRKIARAEFLKMTAKLFKLSGESESFDDVGENDWFAPFIAACRSAGIVEGYDNMVYPNDTISREDAAVILHRAMKLSGDGGTYAAFSDEAEISDYAREAVNIFSGKKLIFGYEDGTFRPHDGISRAETAVLMERCLSLWEEQL